MKTATETRQILEALEGQHPNADTELRHTNAFELLVATILLFAAGPFVLWPLIKTPADESK